MAKIKGTKNKDKLKGGDEDDTIVGKAGNDKLKGNGGDDVLKAGSDNDKAYGGDGDDTILGGSGNDKLWGDAGEDFLDGGSGRDKIDGGADNDELHGGDGDDELTGGDGDDEMYGGEGVDSYFFNGLSSGRDDIFDFEIGTDKIFIDASGYGLDPGMDVADFLSLFASPSDDTITIHLDEAAEDDSPQILLRNVDSSQSLEGSLFLV